MAYLLFFQTELLNNGAGDTLKELSPWAYVIVILALAVAGTFIKFYVSEKNERIKLEKEFRDFMSISLSKQIDVSKDVIQLVSRNKDEVKDALNTFNASDIKVEHLITEVKGQLSRIEAALSTLNSN